MKRSSGALICALALAIAAGAPAAARAGAVDESQSLVEFKLPSRDAIPQLTAAGADLAEYVRDNPDGTITVDAWVTPQQQAQYEALGFPAGATVDSQADIDAGRAERERTLGELAAARANLQGSTHKAKALLAGDTVTVQRADYFSNYAGRFISIEAVTSDGKPQSSQNPIMAASFGTGTGNLSPFIDDGAYLYHRGLFRIPDGDPVPTSVGVASANGGSDTMPVKAWVSDSGHDSPAGFIDDFTTHYTDSTESFAKLRALAAEFPDIAEIIDLPYKTNGYQRKSQTIVGIPAAYAGSTSTLPTAQRAQAVQVTSKAWGQDGGNDVTIQLKDPGAASQPLSVSVTGSAITVNLATDDAGNVTSMAFDVVAAINADAAASALVLAERYHGSSLNDASSVVVPGAALSQLSDFLEAPASVMRGPQQVQAIRIGAHRDGSKTGVFLYCQEHAREWVVPLVCLETAERLVRNYATDPETKAFVDNLDIFILPSVNADGADYTLYDFGSQRKNMVNYCPETSNAPTDRDRWGVDLNRNFSVGSIFDGYDGASSSCTSEVFSGPFELSEPEVRNEIWLADQHPNIKLSNNIHSYGGYFMWAPGAYKSNGRETLPYASYGINQYFEQTAATVLDRIKSYRGTAILPARTGPVADVLYSAAGNSSDEAWYNRGIIGYDFEVGADRFRSTTSGTSQQAVGFFPEYVTEGHAEAMEFADGNYGILEAALAYERDHSAPQVTPRATRAEDGGLDVLFDQSEPATIHYTTDGSTPTEDSTAYGPSTPRSRLQPFHVPAATTLRWMATDVKGQTSVGSQTFTPGGASGTVPATLSLTLGAPPSFGAFTPGVDRTYDAQTTANVISTAGDATLSVSDPGHLANGAFSLPQPLEVLGVPKSYDGPVSNDLVAIGFKQAIGATDALRTGAYSKTLTFTLSTATP